MLNMMPHAMMYVIIHISDVFMSQENTIAEMIENVGYDARPLQKSEPGKIILDLPSITADNAEVINTSIESVPGIVNIELNVARKQVTVHFDPDLCGPRSIIDKLQQVIFSYRNYN